MKRREFLGITAGASAALAFTPELIRALQALQQPGGKLIQRVIPSSGELLPVIGLTFANHAGCADPAALKEVLKTFVQSGGKVFDSMQASEAAAEKFHATVARELGIQNKLFWSTSGSSSGIFGALGLGRSGVKAHIETWLARLNLPRLDSVMISPVAEPKQFAALREMKKQGLVRYIGVQAINPARHSELEAVMGKEPIDFIGVNYAVDDRGAERTILPLAMQRKIAVMALMPFGGANGASCSGGKGLFARVANQRLPEWAAEFDAKTWGQFFLKYVVSHPAVTVVRVGTTKPAHMLDNIGGGIGRLPNEATRKRMAELIDSFPKVVPPAILDRYVGEFVAASGFTATFRRDGDKLFVKSGRSGEALLIARTNTRFVDPQGRVFEFQNSGVGPPKNATDVILEQGPQRTTLSRK